MISSRLQIPAGMQDTLPDECYVKRRMESELRELFTLYGYREIETPILEYYHVFDDSVWGYRPEHIWKTFDAAGHILAVRPDSTIPAARIAAGPLKNEPLPLRLCYLQPAAAFEHDTLSMLCENPQAGVELMGPDGPEADCEAVSISVEALRRAGLKDFQIELGHAGFFAGLMAEAGLSGRETEEIRRLVEQKNALGIQLCLDQLPVSADIAGKLMRLPRLFGGLDVLDEAESFSLHPSCRGAISDLRRIVFLLKQMDISAEIAIDLGLAQEAGYYSGLIFRGQVSGIGQPILSGGRYDRLSACFGRPIPAVGFALSIKSLLIALEQQGGVMNAPGPGCVIGVGEGGFPKMVKLAREKRSLGISTVIVYHMTENEVRAYTEAQGASEGYYLTDMAELRWEGARKNG